MCLTKETSGIIAAILVPAIPAPNSGNIKNQTSATVSAVTKKRVLSQVGPHKDGAMPAYKIANRIAFEKWPKTP